MRIKWIPVSVLAQLLVYGEISAKPSYKLDAFVFSELQVENLKNGETNHEGRLQLESKRKNGVRGEFQLRGEPSKTISIFETLS